MLADEFYNLEPVQTNVMIAEGAVKNDGHTVCKISDTNYILDPAGDYINYSSVVKLTRVIVPWIYCKQEGTNIYLSQNHMPFQFDDSIKDNIDDDITEWDILRLSSGPFYKGFRALVF